MKIIPPSFEIIKPASLEEGIQQLRRIEAFARISHKSEDKQTEESWQRFIPAIVIQHGDWSVVEHEYASVVLVVDRGISHELVRHRLFSYTQESTRFVNYAKKGEMNFIQPEGMSNLLFVQSCQHAEQNYLTLLGQGYKPQEARAVLPNALATTIAVTGNLRSWRWLFLARTTLETHPDFKRLVIPLLEEFKKRIPILFDDIEPLQKQSVSIAKVH